MSATKSTRASLGQAGGVSPLSAAPTEDSAGLRPPLAAAPRGEGTLFRAALVWAVYALVVVATVRPVGEPVFDPDIWWHLRVGQWVAHNGQVTADDPFSQQARPWAAYSWLYEVLVYGFYRAAGLAGIVLYRLVLSLLVVAAIHALVRRLEPRFLVATGLTAAAALAVAPLMSERPWLFTVLFATLTLHAALELRQRERPAWWVWTLPFAYVLWANIHIQFVYGLFLLFLALLAPLIDSRLGLVSRDGTASAALSRGWWRLLALASACFLATFVNPYGARLYLVIAEYATQPGPFRFVNELKALEFREVSDWVMLGLTAAACFALGRRKVTAFEVLLLAGTALFAFRARRDLWFVVLADLVILATVRPRESREEGDASLSARGWAMVAAGLAALALGTAWVRDLSPAGLERRVAKVFPVEAAGVVRERGLSGPLYNDFNWGGYLIWALPELPAAIDGRTNLHGDERIERFGRTWCALPGWERDEDLSRAGVVVAQADSALAAALRRDPRFRVEHEDRLAVVFVRR